MHIICLGNAEQLGLGTSLFLRLQAMGLRPMLLDTQYRWVHAFFMCWQVWAKGLRPMLLDTQYRWVHAHHLPWQVQVTVYVICLGALGHAVQVGACTSSALAVTGDHACFLLWHATPVLSQQI